VSYWGSDKTWTRREWAAMPQHLTVKHAEGECAGDCDGVFQCPTCGGFFGYCYGAADSPDCNDCYAAGKREPP